MENALEGLREEIIKQLEEREREFKIDFLRLDDSDFRRRIEAVFKAIIRENRISLKKSEHEELLSEVISYFLGLGPIDILLKNPEITEIMVNGPKRVYIEKDGNLELSDISFRDDDHLFYFIDRILAPLGRRVSEYEPYIDARLKDGSRVNIVRHPVSTIGPILTIRKFSYKKLGLDDLIRLGTLDNASADFLKACVVSRLNILISGSAGSGKTTLLNALGTFIPDSERVITIEETRELHLDGKHCVPMETRPPNIEGKGEITIRDLLRNSLHMRPDRIIVGEVRSEEVLDMVQAMNTGHEGSMTTLHANSCLEVLDRLEVLVLMGSLNISSEVAKRQIIGALDLIVQMSRMPDGTRKVIQISEVLKAKEYSLRDIFVSTQDQEGSGKLIPSGNIPNFYPKLKKMAHYVYKEFEPES